MGRTKKTRKEADGAVTYIVGRRLRDVCDIKRLDSRTRSKKGNQPITFALGDVTDLILCLTVKVEQAGGGGPFRSSLVFDTLFECVSRAFECFKYTLSNYLTKDNC